MLSSLAFSLSARQALGSVGGIELDVAPTNAVDMESISEEQRRKCVTKPRLVV